MEQDIIIIVETQGRMWIGRIHEGKLAADAVPSDSVVPYWFIYSDDVHELNGLTMVHLHQPRVIAIQPKGQNEMQRLMHPPLPSGDAVESVMVGVDTRTNIYRHIPKDIEHQYRETTSGLSVPPPPTILRPVK